METTTFILVILIFIMMLISVINNARENIGGVREQKEKELKEKAREEERTINHSKVERVKYGNYGSVDENDKVEMRIENFTAIDDTKHSIGNYYDIEKDAIDYANYRISLRKLYERATGNKK